MQVRLSNLNYRHFFVAGLINRSERHILSLESMPQAHKRQYAQSGTFSRMQKFGRQEGTFP